MKLHIFVACLALASATPDYQIYYYYPLPPAPTFSQPIISAFPKPPTFTFPQPIISAFPQPSRSAFKLGFSPKLAFEIFKLQSTSNVILSPASVFMALGLAYLGAGGRTEQEMHNILQFGTKTKQQVAQSYAEFMQHFQPNKFDTTTSFHIANRIFVNRNYELAPRFNEYASTYFLSSADRLDFTNSAQAAQIINSWVAEKTNQKIQSILSPENIKVTAPTILVNAIYFKAPWKHPFEVAYTRNKYFSTNQYERVPVDMMYQEHSFQYAIWHDLDATAIQIPFANTDIHMLVVLPNRVDGLQLVEQKMHTANLMELQKKFFEVNVKLSLPKFKFEYSCTLSDVLKQMGLGSMFQSADFSNLLANDYSIPIDEVFHKAFIAVDEIGTEASAATALAADRSAKINVGMMKTYEFNADHPFLFAIMAKDIVYFAGHVNRF